MLTKKKCKEALEQLDLNCWGCEYACDMSDDKPCVLKEIIGKLIDEHFELIEKYQNLQDENARLSFDKIVSNIQDMGYKLWLENPPLKFEELKPKMWVWDNERKRYDQILEINIEPNRFYFRYIDGCFYFEENRFYRKQVE